MITQYDIVEFYLTCEVIQLIMIEQGSKNHSTCEFHFAPKLNQWIHQYPISNQTRPDWNDYFLMLAFIVSRRSSCLRKKVGAVLVNDKDVISTGYNGAPTPQKNCLEIGKCYRDKHTIESGTQLERCRASGSHAESNAIALAAKNGHSTRNAILYLYGHLAVCNMCRGIIANSHISKVIHLTDEGKIKIHNVSQDWIQNPLDFK